jgi:hypothetical protein
MLIGLVRAYDWPYTYRELTFSLQQERFEISKKALRLQ